MKLKDRIAAYAYLAAEWGGMRLPERVLDGLASSVAWASHRFGPGTRRTVSENLARVLGEEPESPVVQAAVREAYQSYLRYWRDTFRARVIPREELFRRYHMPGEENVEKAAADGRGAIVALPHLGNWDLAGRYLADKGYRITAVAETLEVKEVFELFLRHRRELGMNIVPLSGDRKVGEELARLLGENHIIALVADRDLKGTGVPVRMFGAMTRVPAGPALLSLATGSPLLTCAPYDTPGGWTCVMSSPLTVERTDDFRKDVAALTRKLAREYERAISANPTQWHMFQPFWNSVESER